MTVHTTTIEVPPTETRQIGVSRPPLRVMDLPTPEEVFKIPGRIGPKALALTVIGPSLIALGVSIGSGEWLMGPFSVAKFGFVGIGILIFISAALQVFYNVELARYTVATGETPLVGFGRVPPGYLLWTPLAVFLLFFAFVWGGWAAIAGDSLFVLINQRPRTPEELTTVRWLGVLLLGVVCLILLFGKRISRTLEIINWVVVTFILFSMTLMVALLVPFDFVLRGFASLVTPAMPPAGATATDLGSLVGFTLAASGLNYFIISHYRDKGYGMGHRVGYIAGAIGGQQPEVLPSGVTFPEDERNAGLWKRWFRLVILEQWGIYFTFGILGMMLPTILVGYLAELGGVRPTLADMPVFAAMQLRVHFGDLLFIWALLVGLLVLLSTQMVIFEALVRQFVDGAYATSPTFRRLIAGDPRRFYYPFMAVLAIVISILIFQALPFELVRLAANMANLAAMIMPFALIYLNRRLPQPARMRWWSYVVLVAFAVFFGFFFVNFAFSEITGQPIVRF
jgi:hypothetical protein